MIPKLPSTIQQRRKPAKRAFHGLIGSPLAEVIPFPVPEQPIISSPKRGRPRKHTDDATKQRAYRSRKNSTARIENALKAYPVPKAPEASQIISTDDMLMLPAHDKWFIPGAPHGKGLMITGGYNQEKVDKVYAATDRDENGRRVRPKGHGKNADARDEMTPEENKSSLETEWTFSRKIRFPKKDVLTDYEKEEILKDLIRENTEGTPESTDGWDENSVVHINPSTLRCLLCDEPIVTLTWTWQTAQQHFLLNHKSLVRKAWKFSTPATGEAVSKLRPQEFRNTQSSNPKTLGINNLTSKIALSPIRGGAHNLSSSDNASPQVDPNIQDIQNKEVA